VLLVLPFVIVVIDIGETEQSLRGPEALKPKVIRGIILFFADINTP
jgi:hypothetical protein